MAFKTHSQDVRQRCGIVDRNHRGTRDKDTFCSMPRWRRLRAVKLRANPICESPEGCDAVATEVDHITPRANRPDLAYDWDNLQSLCKSCHTRKTNQERMQSC